MVCMVHDHIVFYLQILVPLKRFVAYGTLVHSDVAVGNDVGSQCAFRWVNSGAGGTGKFIARVILSMAHQIDVGLESRVMVKALTLKTCNGFFF